MKELKVMMSFLLLSLGCLTISAQHEVLTKEFRGERSKAGEATINNQKKYAKGNMGYTAFEVSVPKAGNYYVNFWMIPTQEADGKPTEYAVEVNGQVIVAKIVPTKCDWQAVGLLGNSTIALNAGVNTIAVFGNLPFLPEVETLRLSMDSDGCAISSEEYDAYKNNIMSGTISRQTTLAGQIQQPSSDRYNCPLYGTALLGEQINYTFTTTVYLNSGTLCNVTSTSSTSHYLEIFSEPNQAYSNRILSSSGQASTVIHSSGGGIYVVRVRSSQSGVSGYANVNISTAQYTNVPIYDYEIAYVQPTDQVYNSFLCYLSGSGDPYLDLMSYSSNKIYLARNDDGSSYSGDFNWGDCPRIRKQLSTSSQYALAFTNSSLYPTCTADIYLGFPNFTNYTSTDFPNLKAGDAIASAPATPYGTTPYYNCIAWTAGITSSSNWPPLMYPLLTDIQAFDYYYALYGYTRTGATSSNSIIDLYKDNNNNYTHASIRKNNNNDPFPHGYAWESKLGEQERIYHPRNALQGGRYGNISDYYRDDPSSIMAHSLFENVAEGRIVIENVQFSQEEMLFIDNEILQVSSSSKSNFLLLYNSWIEIANHSISSNPDDLKKCKEYELLHNYCQKNKNIRYVLFKMLSENDQMVQFLIGDLLNKEYENQRNQVITNNIKNEYLGDAIIYRTSHTNTIKFVKLILEDEIVKTRPSDRNQVKESGISYSDKKTFSAKIADQTINVDFQIPEDANISLIVYTLDGTVINHAINDQRLSAGSHSYTIPVNKAGTYLVVYAKDGTTSVKKVIIK